MKNGKKCLTTLAVILVMTMTLSMTAFADNSCPEAEPGDDDCFIMWNYNETEHWCYCLDHGCITWGPEDHDYDENGHCGCGRDLNDESEGEKPEDPDPDYPALDDEDMLSEVEMKFLLEYGYAGEDIFESAIDTNNNAVIIRVSSKMQEFITLICEEYGIEPSGALYKDYEIALKLSDGNSYTYTGKEIEPATISNSFSDMWMECEFVAIGDVYYENNIKPGTATAKVDIILIDGEEITLSKKFTILGEGESAPEEDGSESDTPFKDVDAKKWYYNAVNWAFTNGLLTGTSDTEFSPNGQMTRGMLVTVLYRMEGRPTVTESNKFPDVPNKKYYADAIIWASSQKIVSGYNNGKFGPEDSITREQIAKILYLYAKHKGYDITASADISDFADASKVSGYAEKYMKWAVAEELIKGSNGKLNPQGEATRAEIAAILKRFVEKYEA